MKGLRPILPVLVALFALAAVPQQVSQPKLGRSIHGVVLDAVNRPLAGAIVYLENYAGKVIGTAIADDQGAYSFHDLDTNINYSVYAVWQGHRSPVRTDSQWEMTQDLRLDLQIPPG